MREEAIKDESGDIRKRVIIFCAATAAAFLAALFMFLSVLYLPNIMYFGPAAPWKENVAIYYFFSFFKAINRTLQSFISGGTGFSPDIASLFSTALLFGCVFSFLVPLVVCAVTGITCAVTKRFAVNRVLIAIWLVSAVSFFVLSNIFDHGFGGKNVNFAFKEVAWGAVLNVILALGIYCATFFVGKQFKAADIVWAGCGALSVLSVCLLACSIGGNAIQAGMRNYYPQSIVNRFMLFFRSDNIEGAWRIFCGALGLAGTLGVLVFSLCIPVLLMFLPKDKKVTRVLLIVACALVALCALGTLLWLTVGTVAFNIVVGKGEYSPLKINAALPFILILSIINTVAVAVSPLLLKKFKKY